MRRIWFAIAGALAFAALRCAAFDEGADVQRSEDGGDPDATSSSDSDSSSSSDGGADADGSCGTPDFANDPKNCGRCDHSCAGGGCVGGVCQPFALMQTTSPGEIARSGSRIFVEVPNGQKRNIVSCPRSGCGGSEPDVVIADIPDVKSMIFDDGRLYFATQDPTTGVGFDACDPDKCSATKTPALSPPPTSTQPLTPLRVVDGEIVFAQQFVSVGEVRRLVAGGPAFTSLANLACAPVRIAAAGSALSWTCVGSMDVFSCTAPCGDGGASTVSSPYGIGQIERFDQYLVWEDGLGNLTVTGPQTPVTLPSRGTGPIALVGSDLFFENSLARRIETCKLPACANPTAIAQANATAPTASIVADDAGVFWTIPTKNVVMSVAR